MNDEYIYIDVWCIMLYYSISLFVRCRAIIIKNINIENSFLETVWLIIVKTQLILLKAIDHTVVNYIIIYIETYSNLRAYKILCFVHHHYFS